MVTTGNKVVVEVGKSLVVVTIGNKTAEVAKEEATTTIKGRSIIKIKEEVLTIVVDLITEGVSKIIIITIDVIKKNKSYKKTVFFIYSAIELIKKMTFQI